MTLTLELPDDIAEHFQSIPEQEWPTFAVSAIREKLEAIHTPLSYQYTNTFPRPLLREECTSEEIEDIEQGIADIDAGRVTDGPAFFAEMRQHLETLKAKK